MTPKKPEITVLLCTVRPSSGSYTEHGEWGTLEKVFEDLSKQTYQDFEVVVVDGVSGRIPSTSVRVHGFRGAYVPAGEVGPFPVWHVAPREMLWTHHKKVAISTYRNTGIVFASGNWIVNLDDCCVLPPRYLELFHAAHSQGQALGACWIDHPMRGEVDARGGIMQVDPAMFPPPIYGFGSYPRDLVLNVLNGYDEAYDGGQGLEDADFGARLLLAGVPYWLAAISGFTIEKQGRHSPEAIDLSEPIVKCPNPVWQIQRVQQRVLRANFGWNARALERLVGPCWLLNSDDTCQHHLGRYKCAYLDTFARIRHPLAAKILEEPNWPNLDLAVQRRMLEPELMRATSER